METYLPTLALGLLLFTTSVTQADSWTLASPDSRVEVTLTLIDGHLTYQIDRDEALVILPSILGFTLDEGRRLYGNFTSAKVTRDSHGSEWTTVWGEEAKIRNQYNALTLRLATGDGYTLETEFRLFDDGVGFRYRIPAQTRLDAFRITEEHTEFNFTDNHQSWWIPSFSRDRYENAYRSTPISEAAGVETPFTLRSDNGLHLSVHEAALVNYPSMTLRRTSDHGYQAALYPWSDGTLVYADAPMQSPWRTILIADDAAGLVESRIMLNLNEPNRLEDTSWIEPGKYIGIWWEMHVELATWGPGPKLGATTENAMRYIDFAAEHGFDGVLVEGWNIGWAGDWQANADLFSFTEPNDRFDLEAVAAYAREKGTRLIGHHETSGGVENYESQLEDAYALLNQLDMNTVKTGYVSFGQSIDRGLPTGAIVEEWQHGQHMVRHYQRVTEVAARNQVMLNIHEPVKGTGLWRTWPNLMTREGAKGQEYNAWGGLEGRNSPEHLTVIPFTRGLSGPFDYTPGILDLTFEGLDRGDSRVTHTLAKELASYLVVYSPLHMAADLPEHYEARPELFEFIKAVPTDWENSHVLSAEIGEHLAIARQERGGDTWYLGAVTDADARQLFVPLDFLDPDQAYEVTLYHDGPDAHWDTNPYAVEIETLTVDSTSMLDLELAPGGGAAAVITKQ